MILQFSSKSGSTRGAEEVDPAKLQVSTALQHTGRRLVALLDKESRSLLRRVALLSSAFCISFACTPFCFSRSVQAAHSTFLSPPPPMPHPAAICRGNTRAYDICVPWEQELCTNHGVPASSFTDSMQFMVDSQGAQQTGPISWKRLVVTLCAQVEPPLAPIASPFSLCNGIEQGRRVWH